jgi:glycine cleavage system H protein
MILIQEEKKMNIAEGLLYSKDHEWVRPEGDTAYVGVTDYAQHNLGDIVFVDLPAVGTVLSAGDVLGSVDSVKAASDIYTPVSGEVIKVNDELSDTPEKVNSDAYSSWIAVLKLSDPSELDGLMDAAAYKEHCLSEE